MKVVGIAPIQLGEPGRFPARIGGTIESSQDLGHDVQPIAFGQREHVPEKVLCGPGHDH